MTVDSIESLFVQELSDMHNAEKQLTKALPKLAKAAADPELSRAFQDHLKETERQVTRLEKVAEICGVKIKRKKCAAMEGLIAEGSSIIQEIEEGYIRDLALTSAASKVEHYEIASYLSLMKLAKEMDNRKAFSLLDKTLAEEEKADKTMSYIADECLEEAEPDEEEEDEESEDEDEEESSAEDEEGDEEDYQEAA